MADSTKPIPPVPDKADIIDKVHQIADPKSSHVSSTWVRWFLQVRDKINLINELIASLSGFSGTGFLSIGTDGTVQGRTIEGTTDRINVDNGDGQVGNPVIDLVDTGVTPGNYTSPDITILPDGRISAAVNGSGGGGGYGQLSFDGGSIAIDYDDIIDGGALPYRSADQYDAGTVNV